MENSDINHNVSSEEMAFNNLIMHGDDFMKIQIYRNARECYTQALESNFNNELAGFKLAECSALIKTESKTIIMVVITMMVVATFRSLLSGGE